MTKDEILEYFKDINHAYNDCTRYDTLKHMLDELQEPCGDAISRDMALEKMGDYAASGYADSAEDFEEYSKIICQLPPVTPQYTEAEIQKMQDLEFAEIQKAYEIGKAEGSIGADVLDKIRAEIDSYCSDNRDRNDGLYIAMRIIDKYKARPTGGKENE